MKVIRLRAENVMRLTAIDVTPAGDLVVVGGPNGAGKSSVLNAIAMALGGAPLAPDEPIRAGEASARAEVDLGDLVVTRTWSRERVYGEDCAMVDGGEAGGRRDPGHVHGKGCPWEWSPTVTRLQVTAKALEGTAAARLSSPQAVLDSLLGRLTFDPLAFSRLAKERPKDAGELLRQAAGLDLSDIDRRRAATYAERADANRQAASMAAIVGTMPHHEGAGTEEEDVTAIAMEVDKAVELEKLAMHHGVAADEADKRQGQEQDRLEHLRDLVKTAERALEEAREAASAQEAKVGEWGGVLAVARRQAQESRAAVPELAPIRDRLRGAEAKNAKARANRARAEAQARADAKAREAADLTARIKALDEERAAAIAAAKFPVPGLSVADDGTPTINGLPLAQASSSEQLRTSVALGAALSPKLRVMLVRNGNLLDEAHLAALGEMAAGMGVQLWVEWVTSGAAGPANVLIEDGHVAEAGPQRGMIAPNEEPAVEGL
jgi:ABC-type cobalamin/Fe3+-siderophores transport system ATPase subunit